MPTWSELVRLMAACSVTARGVHRSWDPDEPPAVTVEVIVDGPDLWRVQALDGSPLSLSDGQRILEWQYGGSLPRQWPVEDSLFRTPDPVLLLSPMAASEWHPDDYHRPACEPVRAVVLGRPCWRVDLLPPAHKEGLLCLWIDEATGARLLLANEQVGILEEFLELELPADFEPDAFSHDGTVDTSPSASQSASPRPATATMYHVSSSRNRQSIADHGLDWRRMGAAPGIAGSRTPEQPGCFLAQDEHTRDWFIRMNNTGGPVDVWEVADVRWEDLQDSPEGYVFFPGVIGVERLRLLQRHLLPQHD